MMRKKMFSLGVKRLLDIVGAFIGIVVLSPLMLLIALLVWVSMGSPVLFRQVRPTLYGKPFGIVIGWCL